MFGLRKVDSAKRLRVIMAELDINVSELSNMTGLHKNTISAIRTGETTTPNHETRYLIARALNVKPDIIWPNM